MIFYKNVIYACSQLTCAHKEVCHFLDRGNGSIQRLETAEIETLLLIVENAFALDSVQQLLSTIFLKSDDSMVSC